MATIPNISQAGFWDDGSLVDSWNEAVEEYKVRKFDLGIGAGLKWPYLYGNSSITTVSTPEVRKWRRSWQNSTKMVLLLL